MPRPRCSVYIAVSVDGFIARSDDSLDWLESVQREGEDYGFADFVGSVDALLMGRRTYEVALGFDSWPYADRRCIVLTKSPGTPRHDEELTAEQPAELVERLGREGARRVYVDGGAVIRSFLAAGLVDDLTLSVIPTLLGDGIPLFGKGVPYLPLELLESKSFPSGLVQLRYRLAGSAWRSDWSGAR